jgi:hypothetical protein
MSQLGADIILYNANIITLDPRLPRAKMMAIKGERVLGVGGDQEWEQYTRPQTKIIDCQGKTLIPGFNDAHCHILSYVQRLLSLDCSPSRVRSIEEIKSLLRKRAEKQPPGTWVLATGYNDFYLAEHRHPTRWDLDEATPHHPVRLDYRTAHACVLNSLALKLAGITIETPDPPGGLIDRDPQTGEPTGILYEMGSYLSQRALIPPLSEEELTEGMKRANRRYLSQGITSLQDASQNNDPGRWQLFQQIKGRGELTPQLSLMMGLSSLDELQEQGLEPRHGDDQLRLGALKVVIDESTGSLRPPPEELRRIVLRAHRAGFQVALHAIEESQVEAATSALEYALKESPIPHRHRIEHCSVCPPHLLERLKKTGAVVVTQPAFIYYSGERYLSQVPPSQLPWLYRIGSFLGEGITTAASSDSPVVPHNPLVGIYAAVTRKAETGQVLSPPESVTPHQALHMYTLASAYAAFEERVKGSLEVGKLADMALLSADPTQVPPEEIREIRVEMTIVGGRVVWEAV